MIPLILQVENTNEHRAQSWAFRRSPVRIGRHPFNSLRLNHEFVSQWHAVVRFHSQRTTYLDLGSTNRTQIDGRTIQPNEEVEVTSESDVRIGSLRLHFIRDPDPPAEIPSAPSAHVSLMQGTSVDAQGMTVVYPGPRQAPHPPVAPRLPERAAPPRQAQQPGPAAAYQAWRATFADLLAALKAELDATPEAERGARAQQQLRSFPELAREEPYRAYLTQLGLAELLPPELTSWLRERIGGFFELRSHEVPITFARAGQLIDMFAEAFIATRRDHERICTELALERHVDQSLLQRTEDCHALLAYLLNPQVGDERLDELTRVLADLAMHQVAILSGSIEGARAVLSELAPDKLSQAPAPPDNSSVLEEEGPWQRLIPHPSRGLWRKYLHKYRDLLEGDHFVRALFGRDFARRYYALASASGDGSAVSSEPK